MRTSEMGRFPGFSASVVCVSTNLLSRLGGGSSSTVSTEELDEARSLARSVDEVNIPFGAGITYINRVVSIVDMNTMTVIRKYAHIYVRVLFMFFNCNCIGCQLQLTD